MPRKLDPRDPYYIDNPARVKAIQREMRKQGLDVYLGSRIRTLTWTLDAFIPWRSYVVIPAEGLPTLFTFVIDAARLAALVKAVGRQRLVLDLSCRRRAGDYWIVTDRWQKFTDVKVDAASLAQLARHCDEFLVHGVDVEGKMGGIEADLVRLLGAHAPIPTTYAGGVRSLADLEQVRELGGGRVDVTIGSALDLFGGQVAYRDVVAWHRTQGAPPGK